MAIKLSHSASNVLKKVSANSSYASEESSATVEAMATVATTLVLVGLCCAIAKSAPTQTRTLTITRTVFVPVDPDKTYENPEGNVLVR